MNFMQQFDTVSNSEAGAKLHFKLPSGELAYIDADQDEPVKAVTVTMLGSSSKAHEKMAAQAIRDMRIKSKKERNKKEDEIKDSFFDEIAEAHVKRLVAVVTSWENILDDKGGMLECTKENVAFVFTKYKMLRDQAIAFLEDDANFIKG